MYSSKIAFAATFTALLASASAQEVAFEATIWENQDSCRDVEGGDGETTVLQWFEQPACMERTFNYPDWEQDENNYYHGYLQTRDLDEDCLILFSEPNPDSDNVCGIVYQQFSDATDCVPTYFRSVFSYVWCCGEDCDPYLPAIASNDTSALAAGVARNALREPVHPDVTAVKRRSPFERKNKRQDSCEFHPTSDTTRTDVGSPQRVASNLNCPVQEDPCLLDVDVSVSTSYTNSFEVSTELGAMFEVISASVSFSYTFETTEEYSYGTSYTAPVQPGTRGYLTFTPILECTDGYFTGDCDWDNGSEDDPGTACIPRTLENEAGGIPDGTYQVVTETR